MQSFRECQTVFKRNLNLFLHLVGDADFKGQYLLLITKSLTSIHKMELDD